MNENINVILNIAQPLFRIKYYEVNLFYIRSTRPCSAKCKRQLIGWLSSTSRPKQHLSLTVLLVGDF